MSGYDPYSVVNDPNPRVQGRTCKNCGQPGHEHDRDRDRDCDGRIVFRYLCDV